MAHSWRHCWQVVRTKNLTRYKITYIMSLGSSVLVTSLHVFDGRRVFSFIVAKQSKSHHDWATPSRFLSQRHTPPSAFRLTLDSTNHTCVLLSVDSNSRPLSQPLKQSIKSVPNLVLLLPTLLMLMTQQQSPPKQSTNLFLDIL